VKKALTSLILANNISQNLTLCCGASMHRTAHMTARMTQRGFTAPMVNLILDMGVPSDRGDRWVIDRRNSQELDRLITEKRRERKQLDKEVRDLERLRHKHRATVVADGEDLITVFQDTKQG
jgi:hypothetical protein